MSLTKAQKDHLNAPLQQGHIKTREQSGRTFSYIEAWHAIAEANRIFDHEWDRETVFTALVQQEEKADQYGKVKQYVGYTAKVKVTAQGLVREGTGFGQGIDADLGRAHESAIKEAESDAMKRALMTFGNPFGLALYDKDQKNVEKEPEPEPDPKFLARKFLNSICSKEEVDDFIAGCKGLQLNAIEIALVAEKEQVTNHEELMLFIAGMKPKGAKK